MSISATANLVPATVSSIASGSTWQQVFPANSNRVALIIENYATTTSQGIGATESLFVWFGQGTVAPAGNPWAIGALELTAGGSLNNIANYCTSQAIWVWAVTIGHNFVAWQTP